MMVLGLTAGLASGLASESGGLSHRSLNSLKNLGLIH